MRVKIFIAIMILLLVQTGQAEGIESDLLWSYKADYDVRGVSVSSDGSYIAAGSDDTKVYFFNRAGKLLWSYEVGDYVICVSVSSDGSYIVAGSYDNKVYFFNRAGKLLWSYKTGNHVTGVSVSSDGAYIAAGSNDNEVYFFATIKITSSNAIDAAKKAIELGKGSGFNMDEAENLLFEAEDAFDSGSHSRANELAEQAKYKAESIAKEASAAENAINEIKSVIQREESKGFNPVEAESLLSQAEEAFSTGEYIKASELADKAKDHALDIDQDGVSNDADFVPTINNYLIYAGAAILLVALVIAIITGLKAIERFKLEREYKEARRREQEREEREQIRQEAEERRRKIQEILDKIKEVT